MKTITTENDKCDIIHANGLSAEAIKWVFEQKGFFVLDLVGKSYSFVKELAEELINEFPNDLFKAEFSNGETLKSEDFPESKITLTSPF